MGTKQNGFSLVELMIVVAIVGILTAIAYPSYSSYVTRSNRTDAMETLAEIMNQQQRFVLRNRRYTEDLKQLGYDTTTVDTARALYTIKAEKCGPTISIQRCVLLTATPKGTQDGDGNITLNSRGEKEWNGQQGWHHRK